jgi:hypothetical protein
MVVSFIMVIIMSALVMMLRVAEMSTGIGTAKIDLESDVRLLVSMMVKDIRQAKIQELHNNTPATDYIKYNVWVWNDANHTQDKTDEYVEYEYDDASRVVTRRFIVDNDTMDEVAFSNITMPPFYTSYTSATVNSFSSATLLNTRRLIVAVKKERIVRGRDLNFTMVEEMRIRNE